MKKLISLLCVLAVTVGILAIGVVSVSADVPTTELEVKSGDTVKYTLSLGGVPNKIIGCDFSVYYDDSAFTINSAEEADFVQVINPDLTGEVKGNWSDGKRNGGVDFTDKTPIVTLNLTAKKDCTAHISYFIRYMYDEHVFDTNDRPQIDQYQFTCDVSVNGAAVVQNALPELNVEEKQPNGLFVNSRSGKSEDSDQALTGDSIKKNGGASDDISAYQKENYVNRTADSVDVITGNNPAGNSGSNSGNNNNNKSTDKPKENASDNKNASSATEAKKSDSTGKAKSDVTDAEGNEVAGTDATVGSVSDSDDGKSSSPVMWIIIGAVVLIAGGCIAYVVVKGKKGGAPKQDDDGYVTESSGKDE